MHFTAAAAFSLILATTAMAQGGQNGTIPGQNSVNYNSNYNQHNSNSNHHNSNSNHHNQHNTNMDNSGQDIFPDFQRYDDWAICKGQISKGRFPSLDAPNGNGGCVRYFRGIDITGVVTEEHFFFKDGFRDACDCAAKCLEDSATCTNWVWKHTFMDGDDGRRSCTLYSSPNLPSGVTLGYDLGKSSGFMPLQPTNNPQAGAPAPLTFLDANSTMPDHFGVSGFTMQDQNGKQYC